MGKIADPCVALSVGKWGKFAYPARFLKKQIVVRTYNFFKYQRACTFDTRDKQEKHH
jgi:hypothetical protein